jgi:hypothetical protein
MTPASNGQPGIIRTERGLTIARTRITLYDVMDYVTAQYPPKFIRSMLNLTDVRDREYRAQCAVRLVDILLDLENYRGVGRIFIP